MQVRRQKNTQPPSKATQRTQSLFNFREMLRGLIILCANDEVVLCLDRRGLIQDINDGAARRWLNQDSSELINRCVWNLLPPKVAKRRQAIAAQVFASGVPTRVEEENQGRWLDSMVYPVHDQNGSITQVLILSRDVTERKQHEEAMR